MGEAKLQKENADETKTSSANQKQAFTKFVVRRLPPTMTESEFLEQIQPLPFYDYFSFVSADSSLSPWSHCRAYFNMPSIEDVIQFRDRFDGYVFVDSKGTEYPAIVELAPNQKIPVKKIKKDAKCGTIEQDSDFKKFLEEISNAKPVEVPNLSATLAEIEKRDKEWKDSKGIVKVKTPLIEFIEWRKDERKKYREERKRQKEEERQKREEERLKRIEREKAEAVAKEKRDSENEKRKEQLVKKEQNEKVQSSKKRGKTQAQFQKKEKAPRFSAATSRTKSGRSFSDHDENNAQSSEHESGGKETTRTRDEKKSRDNAPAFRAESSSWKEKESDHDKIESTTTTKQRLDKEKPTEGVENRQQKVVVKVRSRPKDRDNKKTSDGEGLADKNAKAEDVSSGPTTSKESKPDKRQPSSTKQVKDSSKARYKDKPSMPLYEPRRRRKQLEATEKPLLFKDPDEE